MKVDFDKVMGYEDDICSFEGFLPLLLRAPFMDRHAKTLEKAGVYDEVIMMEIMSRPSTFEDAVEELRSWCMEKGLFEDIIIKE